MKMFKWGLEGGKPTAGEIGRAAGMVLQGRRALRRGAGASRSSCRPTRSTAARRWRWWGCTSWPIDGTPWRVGFALGNEYSDHVMERQNYLYLAHSKLRQCRYGPELLLGALPASVNGHGAAAAGKRSAVEREWLSGEDNMAHTIANLEHHHFKYPDFRRPGDVHVHFFGAATGSFTKNIKAGAGDVFEIASAAFGRPLRNPLGAAREPYGLVSDPGAVTSGTLTSSA